MWINLLYTLRKNDFHFVSIKEQFWINFGIPGIIELRYAEVANIGQSEINIGSGPDSAEQGSQS